MNAGGKITYTNRTRRKLRIILEPWAEEYGVEPNSPIDIVAHNGTSRGHLEIEQTDEGLIVYGWEGSIVSIVCDGKGLTPNSER
jgi:hypothetical protein